MTIFFPLYLANGLLSDYSVLVKFDQILMLFESIPLFMCFAVLKFGDLLPLVTSL